MTAFTHMVHTEGVNPKDINIMSQYNAQCHKLREALNKEQFKDYNVNTVVASQGRYDLIMFKQIKEMHDLKINVACISSGCYSTSLQMNWNISVYVYILLCLGGEWDYVILSLVRSLPKYRIEKQPTLGWCKENLGFITDEHQINVALTRARKGIIIIGIGS